MGQLKKGRLKLKFCFISGIVIGVLIGTTAFTIIMSYRMDAYYLDVSHLKNIIEDKNARLDILEKTINTQILILDDIEIILNFDGDDMDKMDIEKAIKEKYSTLLGKEVETVDADIIIQVIDNRLFHIEDRNYKLHVNRLILTEVLKIWVNVETLS